MTVHTRRTAPSHLPCIVCGTPVEHVVGVTRRDTVRCRAHAGRWIARIDEAERFAGMAVPFERDAIAQRIVAEHPDGADVRVIADALGLSPARVRQILDAALRSLRYRAQLVGLDVTDLVRRERRHPLDGGGSAEPAHATRWQPLAPAAKPEEPSPLESLDAALRELEERAAWLDEVTAGAERVNTEAA